MARVIKSVALEALAIGLLGLAVGLIANRISPRGLTLARDYFPQAAPADDSREGTPVRAGGTNAIPAASSTGSGGMVTARLVSKGLQPVEREEVLRLFRDARYEQDLIVFVDARDDRHYQEGHIPRAYQFDRYYPERHLAVVLPACLNAERVVVYCAGGECEDSEFAAVALREAGVPAGRIFVYAGGMADWTGEGLPVETGARGSGAVSGGNP